MKEKTYLLLTPNKKNYGKCLVEWRMGSAGELHILSFDHLKKCTYAQWVFELLIWCPFCQNTDLT